jgi:hypothetical protein
MNYYSKLVPVTHIHIATEITDIITCSIFRLKVHIDHYCFSMGFVVLPFDSHSQVLLAHRKIFMLNWVGLQKNLRNITIYISKKDKLVRS